MTVVGRVTPLLQGDSQAPNGQQHDQSPSKALTFAEHMRTNGQLDKGMIRFSPHTLRNVLAILRSLDRCDLVGMSDRMWFRLRDDPLCGYLSLDDHNQGIVHQAIMRRMGGAS